MKVRILKCSNNEFWYNDIIGQEINVFEYLRSDEYATWHNGGSTHPLTGDDIPNLILKTDCEIIEQ